MAHARGPRQAAAAAAAARLGPVEAMEAVNWEPPKQMGAVPVHEVPATAGTAMGYDAAAATAAVHLAGAPAAAGVVAV